MIHKVHDENIYVNLDSLSQLDYWFENFPGKHVGIRCNIENKTFTPRSSRAGIFIGENSRLGLSLEEIKSIKNKELINGLHIYIGTDITDIDYFLSYYRILIELAKDFPNIEYLDFGGGFGIDDTGKQSFDFETYGKGITKLMTDFSKTRENLVKLILEPGRILGGQSGYFICRTTDVKFRNDIQFIGVNASSTQFPRPLLYPDESFHPVWLLNKTGLIKNNNKIKTKINGCSTYSRDYLSHDCQLPKAETGDFIILGNAGAYCASMYTTFLGFEKPKEIFI
jgi:diaminopimelate decarboxylase